MYKNILIVMLLISWASPALGDMVADTVWVSRYDGPENDVDIAHAITLDGCNRIYVTGGSSSHYATMKYSPSGDTLWVRRFAGLGPGEALAMTIDSAGNVCVTGISGTGYGTVKYTPDGDTCWARRYDGPEGIWDWPSDIAVDAGMNVLVTGWSEGWTSRDYATVKYDAFGNQLWARRYSGPEADWAIAIAVDGSGDVYVTGYSRGEESSWDCATIKYDSSGNELWVRRYNGPGNGRDYAYDIAIDASNDVYVAGESFGTGSWGDFTIIKYRPDGDTAWIRTYNGPVNGYDRALAITIDNAGNACATGYSACTVTEVDYLTLKYDSSGNLLWAQRYRGPGNSNDVAFAISTDGSDNVYVTGTSGIDPEHDYATVKYTPDGDLVWVARCNGIGEWGIAAPALAVDDSVNVYIAGGTYDGQTHSDYVTLKYIQALRGDIDRNGAIELEDVMHLIDYLYASGSRPEALEAGNTDCAVGVDAGDVVFLINYVLRGGPTPECPPASEGEPQLMTGDPVGLKGRTFPFTAGSLDTVETRSRNPAFMIRSPASPRLFHKHAH